jgi:hypothetical protein
MPSIQFEQCAKFRDWRPRFQFEKVIEDICNLSWESVNNSDVVRIAHVYYFFSIQFRENLEVALRLYPKDELLQALYREECDTANLSPWEGIAKPGEKLNHDEFVRRLLLLDPQTDFGSLTELGRAYLHNARRVDPSVRAMSIGSYEDQGLSKVFAAILRTPRWIGPRPAAFRHFLVKHIEFDTEPEDGHGALSRHLKPDDRILPLWTSFRSLLTAAAPTLVHSQEGANALV